MASTATGDLRWAPRGAPSLSPLAAPRRLWAYRDLIRQLARREVQQRYRGSALGVAWSVITPLAVGITWLLAALVPPEFLTHAVLQPITCATASAHRIPSTSWSSRSGDPQ
ncbi:MAG TPA: hypothetical protein VFE37_10350 [Chloroflexota bacterium]|nr:hypothetical protein [Chloroflexota bacterium]